MEAEEAETPERASSYSSQLPGGSVTSSSLSTVVPSASSSVVSSSCSWSDAESYDIADRPLLCELEEIPDFRYLSPSFRWISLGAGEGESTRVSPLRRELGNYWEGRLFLDYMDIIGRSVRPLEFSSEEELYFCLCNSILIDDGEQSVALDRITGRKGFTVSASKLDVKSGHWKWISREMEQKYWKMTLVPDSRFPKVAELLKVDDLEIHGVIDTRELSPGTLYTAFFIFELSYPFGFLGRFQETSVRLGQGFATRHTVCLSPMRSLDAYSSLPFPLSVPRRRSDGWKEVEMGDFFVKHGNSNGVDGRSTVRVSLKGRDVELKGGLLLQGIEVRPKPITTGGGGFTTL